MFFDIQFIFWLLNLYIFIGESVYHLWGRSEVGSVIMKHRKAYALVSDQSFTTLAFFT